MARRYFNWKLLAVLVIGFIVLAVTAYGLRKWQKSQKADVALRQGLADFEEKNWHNAAKNFGLYIPSNPDDVDILHKYAEAQLKRRPVNRSQIQQAIAAYRSVLRADKSDLEAVKKLSAVYIQMQMAGEAELIISRFPDSDSNPELGRILASAMIKQRKFHDAARKLEAIIAAHPQEVSAYEALAQLAAQRPENVTGTSLEWLDRAVLNNPDSAAAYLTRAVFRFTSGDTEGGNADLAKTQTLELKNTAEKLRLATVLISAGQLDAAEKYFEEVKNQEPQSGPLWRLWVRHTMASGKKEKMLQIVNEGLKALAPDYWDFMPLAAEVYIGCDKIESAAECIKKLDDKGMVPQKVAYLKARIADKLDNAFESVKAWRNAIRAGNSAANVRLAFASALMRAGDAVSAVKELNELANDNPDYLPVHLALARQALLIKDWQQVSVHSARAKQLSPQNVEAGSLYVQARMQLISSESPADAAKSFIELEKQITELEKVPANALQAGLMKFSIAVARDDFENAEKILDGLKADFTDDVRVAMAFADMYAARGMKDQTIASLTKTIEDFPQQEEPVKFLASILAIDNKRDDSLRLLEKARERIKDRYKSLELSFMLADLLNQWNMQDELYEFLNKLSSEFTDNLEVRTRLLLCRKVYEDADRSGALVDEIKNLVGQDSWQWRYQQARLWHMSERFEDKYTEIVSFLKQNILENPDDQQSRLLLASSYERAGGIQLALSTYREAFDRSPKDLRIIIPMVSALYRAQEFELADEILNSASEENQNNPQLSRMRMHSYLRHGEYSQASEILRNSLILDPENKSDRFSLAMLEMQQQNFAEASRMLEDLRKQEPDSKPVIAAQIQLNVARGNSGEAIRICDEVVAKDADAAAYILRARTLTALGMNDKAVEDLNRAVEAEPENVESWIARSNYYGSQGSLDKALEDIQKAVKLDKSSLTARKMAIQLMLSSGDSAYIQQGKRLLDKALASNPEDIDLKFYQSRVLVSGGTDPGFDKAVEILNSVTEKQPANAQAWSLLARIAMMRSQHGKAIDYALRGLSENPKDRELLLLKARGEASRSPALAIPTLKRLCDLEPDNVDNAIFLADAYRSSGQPDKAIGILKSRLDLKITEDQQLKCRIALAHANYTKGFKRQADTEFKVLLDSERAGALALSTYAKVLAEDKRYDSYLKHITAWTEKNPNNIETAITAVEEFVSQNQGNVEIFDIAEQALLKVIEVAPENAEGLQALAVLYQIFGRTRKASELYVKILEVKPDDVIAMNNLAWAMCDEQGKYKEALDLANRGLELMPEYVDLIDTRGVIYHKLGQFEMAIEDFVKCISLYTPNNPAVISTRLHLARSLDQFGRKEDAIKQLNKAISSGARMNGVSPKDLAEARNLLNELTGRS